MEHLSAMFPEPTLRWLLGVWAGGTSPNALIRDDLLGMFPFQQHKAPPRTSEGC